MRDTNNGNSNMTLDRLTEIMQGEFRVIGEQIVDLRSELKADVQVIDTKLETFRAETKSSIRALAGDIAEIKVTIEDQEHEKRIHILKLEQRHQDGRPVDCAKSNKQLD